MANLTAKVEIQIEQIGSIFTSSNTLEGTARIDVVESVLDGVSDGLVNFALDVSQAKLVFMQSDQDLTVKTNDSGSPQETISLTAGKPLLWVPDFPEAPTPFSDDVTALYVSNASGDTATLRIKALLDATP